MKIIYVVIVSALMGFSFEQNPKLKIWLIGDSTMSVKEVTAYPETGWGMPFSNFFDSSVIVDNRAKNGRSSKSFRAEGLWKPILEEMQEGDHVFIQFGHNDEGKQKLERYSSPEEFRANLIKYVDDSRLKNAIPVLITPVARRRFDSLGKVLESHPIYSDIVRKISKEFNVPLIDLDMKSQQILQQFGPEASKYLFMYLGPNEHPNYPAGKKDDTHFNELGARKMAQVILGEIKILDLPIAKRIIRPAIK